jgi:hypothetical protein
VRGRECLVKSRGDGCATRNSDDSINHLSTVACILLPLLQSLVSRGHGSVLDSYDTSVGD